MLKDSSKQASANAALLAPLAGMVCEGRLCSFTVHHVISDLMH
jgi:hypothetical protein